LDRWSWEQVQLVAECIALHKVQQLEMILGPIATGLGAEYKSSQVRETIRRQPGDVKRRTMLDRSDPAAVKRAQQRDAAILMAAKSNGFRFKVE
jgi:hypothetical protein